MLELLKLRGLEGEPHRRNPRASVGGASWGRCPRGRCPRGQLRKRWENCHLDSIAAAQLKRGQGQGEMLPETGNGWEGTCCPSCFFLRPLSLRAQPHEEQQTKQEWGPPSAPAADCRGQGAGKPKPAQPRTSRGAGQAGLASDESR